ATLGGEGMNRRIVGCAVQVIFHVAHGWRSARLNVGTAGVPIAIPILVLEIGGAAGQLIHLAVAVVVHPVTQLDGTRVNLRAPSGQSQLALHRHCPSGRSTVKQAVQSTAPSTLPPRIISATGAPADRT